MVRFLAPAVALMLSLALSISVASAGEQDRFPGHIVIDGTQCHQGPEDGFLPWGEPLAYGTKVSIMKVQPWDGWTLIDGGIISVNGSEGCLVDSESVVRDDEYLPPTEESPEVVGTTFVNTDANCRVGPSEDTEIRATLTQGEWVTLFDDTQGNWQFVGLEATACYIRVDLLGEQPEAEPVTEPEPALQTEADAPDAPEAEGLDEEPTPQDVQETETAALSAPIEDDDAAIDWGGMPPVETLPSTGVTGHASETNLPEEKWWGAPALLAIILVVGSLSALISCCVAGYAEHKDVIDPRLKSFGRATLHAIWRVIAWAVGTPLLYVFGAYVCYTEHRSHKSSGR